MLEPKYDSAAAEPRIYKAWESSGFFNPDNLPEVLAGKDAEPYTIIMPPPNANGHLHAGHGLDMTLKDIMIRYKRMKGFRALWVPGADHAGFETQIVYEKKLEKEGRSRFELSREELYKEILAFTLENKHNMEDEVRLLGASCDWSREKFTLDPGVIAEVHRTFKKMFDDGLVYRGKRPANWCVKHQTSLSDVETESKEQTDTLYYMQYGPFVVATVRPETMFGDVAIAVHPEDDRYKQYVGQNVTVQSPIGKMQLKVVADEMVDREFGTGAVKITPAHDKNDFELAGRHDLPLVEVIDKNGKLNDKAGKYAGMKIADARKAVVEDLEQLGTLVKKEEYLHLVPTCYKCGNTIEPRVMDQWFVRMQPLAKLALDAVRAKRIEFVPENFEKIFIYWMENTIDWNISRQIVWGIPVPAKICDACGKGFPDLDGTLTKCPDCNGELREDTDTFDTWFSSGQWPLLALGYPDSPDFKKFYPTDFMETGSDLVFKWVPRMVIFGMYLAQEVPFKTVYFHGMVNDAQNRKMSKSKGNVTSPVEIAQKYGTDALRMALVVGNTAGNSMALSDDKIRGYRNFTTKIWNASRFVLMARDGVREAGGETTAASLSAEDAKVVEDARAAKDAVSGYLDKMDFHLAAEHAYHYFWHTFADKVIESARLRSEDIADRTATALMLEEVLAISLTMLHPFVPFVTETVYRDLRTGLGASDRYPEPLLMVRPW